MNKILKPCPVCGAKVKLKHFDHEWMILHPRTDDCIYGLPGVIAAESSSMKRCINSWNNRINCTGERNE